MYVCITKLLNTDLSVTSSFFEDQPYYLSLTYIIGHYNPSVKITEDYLSLILDKIDNFIGIIFYAKTCGSFI